MRGRAQIGEVVERHLRGRAELFQNGVLVLDVRHLDDKLFLLGPGLDDGFADACAIDALLDDVLDQVLVIRDARRALGMRLKYGADTAPNVQTVAGRVVGDTLMGCGSVCRPSMTHPERAMRTRMISPQIFSCFNSSSAKTQPSNDFLAKTTVEYTFYTRRNARKASPKKRHFSISTAGSAPMKPRRVST